jgi:hypothetical protein
MPRGSRSVWSSNIANRQFAPIRNLRIGGDRAFPAVALAALCAAREVTQIMLKV